MTLSVKNFPTKHVDSFSLFGFDAPWPIMAFSSTDDHVPEVDSQFQFDPDATEAVLMGFAHNRRVYLHGPHGSGKSTHIEQVAARLNWPCIRINLDGHVTRGDLIGRDMIILKDDLQVTDFVPGILVWALERPMALVFDEYDAGRPDVMFVIQRLLEAQGQLTLLDQNRVIKPHPAFRLFATANSAGQGDPTGLYAGTQPLNHAQLDRWQVVMGLDYPKPYKEAALLLSRHPELDPLLAQQMVQFADLCRRAFAQGDLSSVFSLRTLITWAENRSLLGQTAKALQLSYFNRCDQAEQPLLKELYQRCFAEELTSHHDA
jgi:cobaltochelatase CobS